ncbi:MAG TPA: SagB/ThcOx family dehydrogenase [Bacillota bacterium]|nr:SagB/ThcOx family dehydrogenase [Bacillota bacterium]
MKREGGRFDMCRAGQDAEVRFDPPLKAGGDPVWDVIRRRRSIRKFTDGAISKKELSQLLWATQGITAEGSRSGFRAAPSAGALYPIETLVAVNRVEGMEPGIYHYKNEQHSLNRLKKGVFGDELAGAALNQAALGKAAAVFAWAAVFERSTRIYKKRAYQYIYLEAGHIAQNLALAAAAMGLGSFQVGAFVDSMVNELFGLDGTSESIIYLSPVGRTGDSQKTSVSTSQKPAESL